MAQILDGKVAASAIKENIKAHVKQSETPIKLTIFQVGDNQASNTYIRNKQRACEEVGIESEVVKLGTTMYDEFLLSKYLKEEESDGVMVQLPLPAAYEEHFFLNCISPSKDIDCLTDASLGKFYSSNNPTLAPCTAQGIIDLLDYYNIPIEGKHAVVVGRSNIVGKPIAHLLTCRNATVTVCHSKTPNLSEFTKRADILVVAIGKANFIKEDMVKEGAVVVDVGINRDENGKLCGDVDFNSVVDKVSAITPVPGGCGVMTVAELLKNTITLHND